MSSLEQAKKQLKNAKKVKRKKQMEWNSKTEDERSEIEQRQLEESSIKEKVGRFLYDLEHAAIPMFAWGKFKNILIARLKQKTDIDHESKRIRYALVKITGDTKWLTQ